MKYFFFVIIVASLFLSCKQKQILFREIKGNKSGIHFNNQITEDDELNVMNYEYLYNGGGVAIGDFNTNAPKPKPRSRVRLHAKHRAGKERAGCDQGT